MNSIRITRLLAACSAKALALALGALGAISIPSSVSAQTFVAEWAEADIGRLGPTGLAIDTVGGVKYLYAADSTFGRIIKFNLATGQRAQVIGTTGFGPVEFNAPYGIAVDPVSHDIYVAERQNRRIQRITSNGTFVMAWGGPGNGDNQFASPIGIAADGAGNVYVVDHGNHRVQKFNVTNSGGTWQANHVRTWGGLGSGPGQLNNPYGIALDAQNTLWVADGGNGRVVRFDANGNYMSVVGWPGTGDGQFITPTWVSFDSAGSMYVTETNSDPSNLLAPDISHQRIQKFNAAGQFVSKWGSYGENGGQFRLPFQVVVDLAGDSAYVSDYYNTRLQKFSLSNTPPPPPPPGPANGTRFVNLSSRLETVDGDASRAFIAGFVVSGTARKQMLIRAIGPGLTQFGVSGTVANPSLTVYSGSTVVAQNDNWVETAAMAQARTNVGAFPVASGSLDAALLVTLDPGAYSVQVGAGGGAGVALVEVYDTETTAPAQLINLSTRGFVSTGDSVLVAGFVIQGTASKRVLIRGVGPGLTAFGVAGALANSNIKVYQGSTLVAQNDDWGTPQAVAGGTAPATAVEISAAATATGAFALGSGSRDAALLVTLPPGAYSAVVAGTGNTTGAGLVEVYEVP